MPNEVNAIPQPEAESAPLDRWWEDSGQGELLIYPRGQTATEALEEAVSLLVPLAQASSPWQGLLSDINAIRAAEEVRADRSSEPARIYQQRSRVNCKPLLGGHYCTGETF